MIIRQGDVLLMAIKEKPKGLRKASPQKDGQYIFAYGETAGACHQIDAADIDTYIDGDRLDEANEVVIVANKPTNLVHYKPSIGKRDLGHQNAPVLPGTYKVIRQREAFGGLIQRRLD